MNSNRARFAPALLSLLLLALGAGTLRAQDPSCRCVDRDGRAIENCVCVRSPVSDPMITLLRAEMPRARIGVALEEDIQGARITEVEAGSPAAAAGLAVGDVITRVGGRSLQEPLPDARRERDATRSDNVNVERLMALRLDWEPGVLVEFEFLRSGARRTARVEPEATPATEIFSGSGLRLFNEGRAFQPNGSFSPNVNIQPFMDSLPMLRFRMDSLASRMPMVLRADSLARAYSVRMAGDCRAPQVLSGSGNFVFRSDCVDGARLVELNPALGEYFGATRGVLVTEVAEDSPLGLVAGDIILSVSGRTVDVPEDVSRILGSFRSDEVVTLRVRRKGQEIEVRGRRRE